MSRAGALVILPRRQRYIDLAGERFREEADLLEDRLWGVSGRKFGYKPAPSSVRSETVEVAKPLG